MLRIDLKTSTSLAWFEIVSDQFDSFLKDHAACERKASATGVNFVVQYPDRKDLIEPMLQMAREELLHFQQVCRLLHDRGLTIAADEKTPYVNSLLKLVRNGRDERFLDRLLMFGIIEARGHERFSILGENLADEALRHFYKKIAEAEERHHELFIDIALRYFSKTQVESRLSYWLENEGQLIETLPLRPAVH